MALFWNRTTPDGAFLRFGPLRYLAVAFLCVGSWMGFPVEGFSDHANFDVERFYREVESNIRAEYDKLFEYAKLERERKAKAGEPQLSQKEMKDGVAGAQSLLYNKSVSYALCGEQAAREDKTDQATEKFQSCFAARLDEMAKYTKLSEYAPALGSEKILKCEMKSRDFKNETRFPPYDFLRNGVDPPLFDFKTMNECLLSDK